MSKMIWSSDGGMVVGLNTTVNKELYIEGEKNDIVRHIQEQRKNLKIGLTDKIKVLLRGSTRDLIEYSWKDEIEKECRCKIVQTPQENKLYGDYITIGDNNTFSLIIYG